MKKLGEILKHLCLLSLTLVCALFSFNFITILIPSGSVPVTGKINICNQASDFYDAIGELNSQTKISENAIVFFDKNEDLTIDENGNYWVTEQTYRELTNTVPANLSRSIKTLNNTEIVYDLTDIANQNGYNVNSGESNIILTRQFASKRLLLKTTNPEFDQRGAIAVIGYDGLYILQYQTEHETREAYEFYATCPDIDEVGTDGLCWVENNVEYNHSIMPLGLSDDYSYRSWGAEKMGVAEYSQYLIDTVKAENNEYEELPEVVVAVMDTGIDTDHPWFENRFLLDENGRYIGKNYSDITLDTEYEFEDDQGHGTHCSGIICDLTLPNVKILPVKFMYANEKGEGVSTGTGILPAINYIMSLRETYNIVAVNMSFGMEYNILMSLFLGEFTKIVQKAYDLGIHAVAAAGNDKTNAANYLPSRLEKVVTVSALAKDLSFAYYSNYGNVIDVSAPGSYIESAYFNGGIEPLSGTSMAAPHVVGYIALLKSDPRIDYSMANIDSILSGTYESHNTIADLGDSGKDIYFGYGMPILDGLTPEYTTLKISSGAHGTISQTGFNMYPVNQNITLNFYPDESYYVSAIYFDGEIIPDVNRVSEYTLTNLSGQHEIEVKFATDSVAYVVNHYWEPIYDLDNPDDIPLQKDYILHESERLYSKIGLLTEAIAKNYQGFTATNNFEQETVTENTVVNIYYRRNQYTLTINSLESGFESIGGAGKYLFGEQVTLEPVLQKEFEWFIWEVNACDDESFLENFNVNLPNHTFVMPACNLELSAHNQPKIFLITIKIIGSGTVTPNSKSVSYGDNVNFEFTPADGYQIKSVHRDGVNLNLTKTSYEVNEVVNDIELTVEFEKIIPDEPVKKTKATNWTDITIWGGGSVVAILLFGGSAIILVLAFRKPRI